MKKTNGTKRIAVILLLVVFLALAGAVRTGFLSVSKAKEALSRIGSISYTEECRQIIEDATLAVGSLDSGLRLSELFDLEGLKDAQVEYIRLAIRDLYLTLEEGSEAEILDKIHTARVLVDSWLSPEDTGRISNYADLVEAENSYQNAAPAIKETEQEEELELCGI